MQHIYTCQSICSKPISFRKGILLFVLLQGVHWEGPGLKMADRQVVKQHFSTQAVLPCNTDRKKNIKDCKQA